MHNKGIKRSFFNLCKPCHGIFYILSDKVCETLYTGDHPHF